MPNGRNRTPFFPGFHQKLFGRARRGVRERLEAKAGHLQAASILQLNRWFGSWIPIAALSANHDKDHSRDRYFNHAVTFWAFLAQVLSPNSSCREIVRRVQAWYARQEQPIPRSNTGAYCRARAKLSLSTLTNIHRHTARELQRRTPDQQLWHGRRVLLVDGTALSMPDTSENQSLFPQITGAKPGCSFPIMSVLGCFSLASGALLHWVEGKVYDHDNRLFQKLFALFRKDDVIVGDRGFSSYANMAGLKTRGIDTVMRLHQAKKVDFKKGKKLADNDVLQTWIKPGRRPKLYAKEQWQKIPDKLVVRIIRSTISNPGFRTTTVSIATTVIDHQTYAAADIARLYLRRWAIELFFRDIKISQAMDVLRCKTPEMVRRELCMHAIAYNLIRGLMMQAAIQYNVALEKISFKGTGDALRQWTDVMAAATGNQSKQRRLKSLFLKTIASDLVPDRPGRMEPRALKRRKKDYQFLTSPRPKMNVIPHRSRYVKQTS